MAGHSKWSTIKRKRQGRLAAGKIFTRLCKRNVPRRRGGADQGNASLKAAIVAGKGSQHSQ